MRNSRLATVVVLLLALPAAAQMRPESLVFKPLLFSPSVPEVQKLPNGITLYLLEDHEVPIIHGFAIARGGSLWEPAGKEGLADIAGEVMRTGGAGRWTGEELDERLELLAGSVEAQYTAEYGTVSFSALCKDFREVLGLAVDVMRSPRFDESKIEVARSRKIDRYRRQFDTPATIADTVFKELLYGGDSPYAAYPTVAGVSSLTRPDLVEFHTSCWQPTNITLAVYGDFVLKEMMSLLKRTIGSWKGGDVPRRLPPPVGYEPAPGVYFVEKKALQQATIRMGHLGPRRNGPDHYALIPMNLILGTGSLSRFPRELISNRGLTYTAGCGVFEGLERGTVMASVQTDASNLTVALEVAREVLGGFPSSGITSDERKTALDWLESSLVFRFASPGGVLSQAVISRLQGFPETYWTTYLDRIRRVSEDDMLAAARRTIHPDRLVVLIVGDKERLGEQLKKLGDYKELPVPKS
ncbi:MAG: pitrilysin family protein [Acidobacteriota bacterium]